MVYFFRIALQKDADIFCILSHHERCLVNRYRLQAALKGAARRCQRCERGQAEHYPLCFGADEPGFRSMTFCSSMRAIIAAELCGTLRIASHRQML